MPQKVNVLTNHVNSFQIHVFVPAGSIYEDARFSGGSHMLEHMMFKNRGKSEPDVAKSLTAIGAIYNAFTTNDMTVFYIKTIGEHYREACKIMAQMMSKPHFNEKVLNNERKVVIEELNRSERGMFSYVNKSILGHKNVYYKSVIGTKRVLAKMTSADLKAYYNKRYKNMVIVANCAPRLKAGVEKLLGHLFGGLEDVTVYDADMIPKASIIHPKFVFRYVYDTQYRSIMSFALKSKPTARQHLLIDFLSHCLSKAGLYSILYNTMRNDKGLVYMIRSLYQFYQYLQIFAVVLDTSSEKTEYLVSVIVNILYTLKTKGLPDAQLAFFKKSYISRLMSLTSCPDDQSLREGFMIFSELHLNAKDSIKVIQQVKNTELMELCSWLFDFEKMGMYSSGMYRNVDAISHKVEEILGSYQKREHISGSEGAE